MAWALGLMAVLGLKINLYNMLVFPLAFGIGVDGAIYVVWIVYAEKAGPVPWRRVWTSGRAVVGSTLTTVAAFGALTISDNPGLASLGKLAILTLSLSLVANLVWLTALMGWQRTGS